MCHNEYGVETWQEKIGAAILTSFGGAEPYSHLIGAGRSKHKFYHGPLKGISTNGSNTIEGTGIGIYARQILRS